MLLLSCFSLIPTTSVNAKWEESLYVINCEKNITLRQSPSTSGAEITKIPLGAEVIFSGVEENGFYQVTYKGKTGYVLASYCTLPSTEGWIGSHRIINCKEWVTLRLLPSTKGDEITKVYLGEQVIGIDNSENDFALVFYEGQAGYILRKYISGTYGNGTWDDEHPIQSTYGMTDPYFNGTNNCYVCKCDSFVTLRKTDSTSGQEICKIDLGQIVYYLGDAKNGFIKVAYNGQVGYILEKYIAYLDGTEPEYGCIGMKVSNCKQNVTLRTSPSTTASAICTIPLGETVYFCEKAGNGFYYVWYQGNYGYVLSEYLKTIVW